MGWGLRAEAPRSLRLKPPRPQRRGPQGQPHLWERGKRHQSAPRGQLFSGGGSPGESSLMGDAWPGLGEPDVRRRCGPTLKSRQSETATRKQASLNRVQNCPGAELRAARKVSWSTQREGGRGLPAAGLQRGGLPPQAQGSPARMCKPESHALQIRAAAARGG